MPKRKKDLMIDAKSTPKARGRRLKSLRMMADLSRKSVEETYHISAETLQSWEDGRYGGLTEKGAKRFIHVLQQKGIKCTIDWLLHGIGMGPQPTDSLYLGREKLYDLEIDDKAREAVGTEDQAIVTELLAFRRSNMNAIDLIVKDDGMNPKFMVGDYVGGRRRFNEEISRVVGRDCIIEVANGEVLLRHLRPGVSMERYTLMCVNPRTSLHEPVLYDVEVVSAAPVVWHRSRDD